MTRHYHEPPDGTITIIRFYLGDLEVTQRKWVAVERNAGFRPKGEDRGQPATGAFSGGGYSGSSRYVSTKSADNAYNVEYECSNCKEPCILVMEWDPLENRFDDVVRHWDADYTLNAGFRECDVTAVRPVATIA